MRQPAAATLSAEQHSITPASSPCLVHATPAMVARNSPAELRGRGGYACLLRQAQAEEKAVNLQQSQKEANAIMKRARTRFSIVVNKITTHARALGPSKRIINMGLARGVQLDQPF